MICRFEYGHEVTDNPKLVIEFDDLLNIAQVKRIAQAMEKAATAELNCMINCSNPQCEKAHGQPSDRGSTLKQ